MVEVLQFKATVWPKVASELTYEAQNFQNFLGKHPPDPPNFFYIPYCKRLKAGQGLGTRLFTNVVCSRPGIDCVLATPLERRADRVGEQEEKEEQDRRKKLVLACQNANQSNHTLCYGGC